jgi:TetR/AcrR family transcriptional regulator, transcriptional repressor of bet genes
MPRPSNKEKRKLQIVEALMKVMATSGYAGATIPLIAKQAGLTAGLVHYHFESKQSILLALVHHLLISAQIKPPENADPISKLSHFIEAHLALGPKSNREAVTCWINIGAEATHQEEVRLAYQQATEYQLSVLESIIDEALRSTKRTTKNKTGIALGILAAIEGCYRLLISAPDLIPSGFASPTVKTMALGLLSAETEA